MKNVTVSSQISLSVSIYVTNFGKREPKQKELKADIEKCKNWWLKDLGDGSFNNVNINVIVLNVMLNFSNVPGASKTDKSRLRDWKRNMSFYPGDGCGILLFFLWGNELCQSIPIALDVVKTRGANVHFSTSSILLEYWRFFSFSCIWETCWGSLFWYELALEWRTLMS